MIQNLKYKYFDTNFFRSFLIYTGAFLFSIILIILVHELGHYLAFLWRGYDSVIIRINPFMGVTSCAQEIQAKDFDYIILGGTVFNLTLAFTTGVFLRNWNDYGVIFVKTYSATAFLIEGMVIIGGLFLDETITDFGFLIEMGWSSTGVMLIGMILVIYGGYLNYFVWFSLGVGSKTPRLKIWLLNLPFILYVGAGVVVGQVLLPEAMRSVRDLLTTCMILHWVYLGLRITLIPVIKPTINNSFIRRCLEISNKPSWLSILIGSMSWVLSIIVLN